MSVKVSEKSNARRRQNKVDKSEIVSPLHLQSFTLNEEAPRLHSFNQIAETQSLP